MVFKQFTLGLACARLSDSIRSGNLLKVKLRRARAFLSTERLSTTISEPGTGYSRIGYINQSGWVSFFRKLISWLKMLSRLGKQLPSDRADLGSLLLYRVAKFS